MRLIDEHNTIVTVERILEKYGFTRECTVTDEIHDAIENIPTAYDIDKVVEELKNMKTICGAGTIVGGDYIHRNDAIEIVKQGGVADDVCKKLVWYRFKTKSVDDYRPLIDMKDIQMPWWCAGTALDDSYVVIVCYLPKGEDLYKYWDDAYDVESADRTKIRYTDRFPKPDWIKEVEQMERLTKIIKTANQKDLIVYTKGIFRDTFPNEMTTDDRKAVLKKLAEYEDSEEQGLLYRHPFVTIKFSKEDMQTLVDEKFKEIELNIQSIRSEAINEFAELLKGNLVRKYANAHPTEQYVALQVTDWCNEIAEQIKTGGDSEQNTNSKNKRMLEVRNTKRDICISCCDKSKAAREISINRDGGIYKGSNIISFSLCNDCLNKLAREFVKFS